MRKFLQPFIPAAFLFMAALIMSSSPVVAKSLTVDVAPNLDTFDAMREAAKGAMMPTGPFFIEGKIFDNGTLNPDGSIPEGAIAIGTFYCWGWTYDGVAGKGVVSQIFAIDGRGEVHAQGIESFDLNRAITGGTAQFVGASGAAHYRYHNLPDSFSFSVTLSLRKH